MLVVKKMKKQVSRHEDDKKVIKTLVTNPVDKAVDGKMTVTLKLKHRL
jgi:hypothetical protein